MKNEIPRTLSFGEIINNVMLIPQASCNALESITTLIKISKGELLFRTGENNKNIYLISKGISRGYVDLEDTEATFGFFAEGKPLFSIQSYVSNLPGYENIELLEDCLLYKFTKHDLEKLYQQDIHLANWGRKLAEISFVETERLLISKQFRSTMDRYEDFQNDHPELMNRIKLKHIASYLGMTQVSLSRIRGKK